MFFIVCFQPNAGPCDIDQMNTNVGANLWNDFVTNACVLFQSSC